MELEEEKIRNAVIKIKMGKIAGIDGIPMEAWKYGGEAIKKGLIEIIKKVWKEGQILSVWTNIGIVGNIGLEKEYSSTTVQKRRGRKSGKL